MGLDYIALILMDVMQDRHKLEAYQCSESRLAFIQFEPETRVTVWDAILPVDALTCWIGKDVWPFGLGTGLRLKEFGREEDVRSWLQGKGVLA
jgi:hypothetical protein